MVYLTEHAKTALEEREIPFGWVLRAIATPELLAQTPDGAVHYLVRVPEYGGRWLRVVAALESTDVRVITAFFDRRVARVQR
jgi:hypothetical protein